MARLIRLLQSDDASPPHGGQERQGGSIAAEGSHLGEDRAPLPSDRDIAVAIRNGDVATFDVMCVTYAQRLWRFAYGMTHSRESAQDIVQDVFLNIWERRDTLQITDSLAGYLFGAVRRRTLVYLRNDRTAERALRTWQRDKISDISRAVEGPYLHVERDDLQRLVARAMAALPEIRREVIALRWVHHLSYEEISQIMNISEEAVRAQVSRGYRVLREVLREMGVDAPGDVDASQKSRSRNV